MFIIYPKLPVWSMYKPGDSLCKNPVDPIIVNYCKNPWIPNLSGAFVPEREDLQKQIKMSVGTCYVTID